jgi:hypothetical protein
MFEREADRVADAVMRMNAPSALDQTQRAAMGDAQLSRHAAQPASNVGHDIPAGVGETLRSSGRPLDRRARTFLEPRFGHDFSGVRVHTDSTAAASASAINALAYTAGEHIVFATGHYDPSSRDGQRLLAHELTHVIQQRGHVTAPRLPSMTSSASGGNVIYRQQEKNPVCSIRTPLYGYDNIRNRSKAQWAAAGFVFCGPDHTMGADYWELWVHPTKGVLHLKVKWKEEPEPEPEPPAPAPAPDDRQKRCADPCLDSSTDEASCRKCCVDTIPEDDAQCRSSCNAACDNKL